MVGKKSYQTSLTSCGIPTRWIGLGQISIIMVNIIASHLLDPVPFDMKEKDRIT